MPPNEPNPEKMQDAVRMVAGMLTGAHAALLVVLGIRLGLYEALAGAGPVTSEELAERTGLKERWLREWLRGQATAKILDYHGKDRFELSTEIGMLLSDQDTMTYLGYNFTNLPLLADKISGAEESFSTGIGVSYTDRDEATIESVEHAFRNWYKHVMVPVALPALDGVVARLEAGAKVADVGCGSGVALVELAQAFPSSQYFGYDISVISLERGRRYAADAGLDNVLFHDASVDPLPADASFDFVTTYDCLHDMTHPQDTAKAIRAAIKPDGVWFIADIRSAPTFDENLDNPMMPMFYTHSTLSCMSSGLSAEGGAGLGTVGLPEPKMRELVEAAGFTRFRSVDIPHPVNAFYEARP